MADEYIRKADAIDDLHTQLMYRMRSDDMKRRLDDWVKTLPSADVVQVVHSTWIEDEGEGYHGIHCLRCGLSIPYGNVMMGYNFCPKCGAKMDAKGEE